MPLALDALTRQKLTGDDRTTVRLASGGALVLGGRPPVFKLDLP